MNAIYARQSVDRVDSISIESQIAFCQYELHGAAYRVYADRGYSGKNTDRPAFSEMMHDVECGLIQKVVVYKLDRISRSILDFSNMMAQFEERQVEFISATEKFDTGSPMGRAMLNLCIVFAQLERETIQKRVADAYFSRSQRSLYMGGRVPYGFRRIPTTLGGIHTAMYAIDPEEAEQIQLIYTLYADQTCSYGDIIRYFQANGILKRGTPWVRTRLADILKNPIYVRADQTIYTFYQEQGTIISNVPEDFIGTNGCYYYKGPQTTVRKQQNFVGNYLVLAPHEGIISADLWLKCRKKCMEKRQITPYQKAKHTWLAGKIKCGFCGYALIDKHYAGTRYCLCSHKMNANACEGPGRLDTGTLEQLIYQEICKKLEQFPALPSGMSYAVTRWDIVSFDDKRQIVDCLIRVIYATHDSIRIEWRI